MSTSSNQSENNSNVKFLSSETFDIQNNNKNIKLTISYNEDIILFVVNEDENFFSQIEYSLYQSLNELLKIDKYFRQFDTLQEVFNSFKILIKNDKLSIIKEVQLVKIKIINSITEKEFFINIPLKEKNIQSEINSLISYTSTLNKRIEKLENQIENNKVLFAQIEQKHLEEINTIKKEINEIKQNSFFKGSNIIYQNEITLILSWLDRKPKDIEILLNSQIDGDRWSTFIEKVENKSPTIVIFKTTENFRFGGFTTAYWPDDGPAKDEYSFIFSLDKKEKYNVLDPEYAIGCGKNSWISFGYGVDLYFYDQCTSKSSSINDKRYYDLPSNYEINGGKTDFMILNYEVYYIKY